jgi:methyl-accepting chemotaxis protein
LDNFHKIERLYGKENKVMKNMKVRTKLNLILVLVILLVALGSVVSVKNMEDVKDKALETMDASSRQSYDDSIKEQVGVVISLLTEINEEYKAVEESENKLALNNALVKTFDTTIGSKIYNHIKKIYEDYQR